MAGSSSDGLGSQSGYVPWSRDVGQGSQSGYVPWSHSVYEPIFRGGKGCRGGRHGSKGKGKGKSSKDGGVRWGISDALLTSLLGEPAGSGGPSSSAAAWLDVPAEQAAAATSLTKDEVKHEPIADSFLSFSGVGKYEICVQPEQPSGSSSSPRTF